MTANDRGSVHLIGSFPHTATMNTADHVFRAAGPALQGFAHRLPDGEPQGWINFSNDAFNRAEGVTRVPEMDPGLTPPWIDTEELKRKLLDVQIVRKVMGPAFTLKPGVKPSDVRFAPTGYVELATRSYDAFVEARKRGDIAPGTKFQQSMPTPNVMIRSFVPEHAEALLPLFEKHLFGEVAAICAAIPNEDLAFQWDVVEVSFLPQPLNEKDGRTIGMLKGLASQISRSCNIVPSSVDLGVHLCYGNAGGRHQVEPQDTSAMVGYANAFIPLLTRRLDWLHMPVPISRDDDAYFAPLARRQFPDQTELFLGLVHPADGLAGAKRRITAAKKYVSSFGVATECGLRFFKDNEIPDILKLHCDAARVAAR